jgi:YfiH family protein
MLVEVNDIRFLTSELLSEKGFLGAFLTRDCGLPLHPFKSEACEPAPGFQKSFGFPFEETVTVNQVHSCNVVTLGGDVEASDLKNVKADGIITKEVGVALGILTADCLPILIADPIQRVVGVVHAGWRGTVARIASSTVEKMTEEFGSAPSDIIAVMGPNIGACCYEVGKEVSTKFKEAFGADTKSVITGDSIKVDLKAANTETFLKAGIKAENISSEAPCTLCNTDLFYSYRREGKKAGRQLSLIMIEEETN